MESTWNDQDGKPVCMVKVFPVTLPTVGACWLALDEARGWYAGGFSAAGALDHFEQKHNARIHVRDA